MLKCSKSTISLYETGDTVPDAKNIVRLCDPDEDCRRAFRPKSVDEASNLEIGGCRAMLFAIGEASAPVGEMAEVYCSAQARCLRI